MKVMVEGLTLERRDGLIAIEGISEVLVRGNEVLLLPVGAEYEPPAIEVSVALDDQPVCEEELIEKIEAALKDPVEIGPSEPKKPAAKKGRPPAKKQSLDPMPALGEVATETLKAIHELGGGSGADIAERCGVSLEAALARITKLRINDLVASTGVRPKIWKLTGKGLDSLGD